MGLVPSTRLPERAAPPLSALCGNSTSVACGVKECEPTSHSESAEAFIWTSHFPDWEQQIHYSHNFPSKIYQYSELNRPQYFSFSGVPLSLSLHRSPAVGVPLLSGPDPIGGFTVASTHIESVYKCCSEQDCHWVLDTALASEQDVLSVPSEQARAPGFFEHECGIRSFMKLVTPALSHH